MTRILSFLTLLLATIAAQANSVVTASSKYVRQSVGTKYGEINELVTHTMIDIEYSYSKTQKVELLAPDNIIKFIDVEYTTNRGSKILSVKFNRSLTINGKCNIKLIVSAPDVTSFFTNSSGNIRILTDLNSSSEVTCTSNSSGNISGLNIKAPRIKFTSNSSGDIKFVAAKGATFNAYCNSSGDIKSESVIAQNVNLYCNSSGNISVGKIVSNTFCSASNSSGNVIVTGELNSDNVKAVTSSSGDIRLQGITANFVEASSGSSSSIILKGICDSAKLAASSCSDILARELRAKNVTATTVSAGASVKCYAISRLEMNKAKNSTIENSAKAHNSLAVYRD